MTQPPFTGTICLHGRYVALTPLGTDDSIALAEAAAGLKTGHPFSFVPDGLAEARKYIEGALHERARGERYPFAIVFQGLIVGTTSYLEFVWWRRPHAPQEAPAALEIGATWLASSAQRTRCNTEAKYLLLAYAFEDWRVERVSFRTDERNARSRSAIERLGARYEGVRRAERLGADGAVRNSAFYSIVASEWPDIKAKLTERLG
ncbi:MAG: GNAT family protein [Rhizomicrobium sp.]